MTVCSKPKTFPHHVGLACWSSPQVQGDFSAHSSSTQSTYSNSSTASLCTNSQTTTNGTSSSTVTAMDEADWTTSSADSLSLPSLPSEEEDWRRFGYLLDDSDVLSRLLDATTDIDTVPYYKDLYGCGEKDSGLQRSNSSPAGVSRACSVDKDPKTPMEEVNNNEVSSMDVEVSSSLNHSNSSTLISSSTRNDKEAKCNGEETSESDEDEEPVAKRTRHGIATKSTMQLCLDEMSSVPKEELIYKFLRSTPNGAEPMARRKLSYPQSIPRRRTHNVCRPWWHRKFGSLNLDNSESEEEEHCENNGVKSNSLFLIDLWLFGINFEFIMLRGFQLMKIFNLCKMQCYPILFGCI